MREACPGRRTYNEIERRQHLWSNEIGSAFSLEDIQSATQCVRRLGEFVKGGTDDDEE
jgi:hypothetical protein